jgi:hypothetical protein
MRNIYAVVAHLIASYHTLLKASLCRALRPIE